MLGVLANRHIHETFIDHGGGDDFARAVVFSILARLALFVLAVFGWVGVVAPVFLQNVEVFVILLRLRGHAVNPAIARGEDDLRLAIDLSESRRGPGAMQHALAGHVVHFTQQFAGLIIQHDEAR